MPYYYNILSSSDDEDIVNLVNRRRKTFKPRHNYIDELDDVEFKMRFRLDKNTVILLCDEIKDQLTFATNRYVIIDELLIERITKD